MHCNVTVVAVFVFSFCFFLTAWFGQDGRELAAGSLRDAGAPPSLCEFCQPDEATGL